MEEFSAFFFFKGDGHDILATFTARKLAHWNFYEFVSI